MYMYVATGGVISDQSNLIRVRRIRNADLLLYKKSETKIASLDAAASVIG